ncbi:MAG: hypothetical protein R3A45_12760 [Bdellovibrionota bacterium]
MILIVSLYAFIFSYSLILTHRSAGPLIAFRRYIYQLKTGNQTDLSLTLREDDFHKELESIANTLKGFRPS